MTFRWRVDDGSTLNDSFAIFQGIQTCIAGKLYIYVIFQGGGGGGSDPCPPHSGSPHVLSNKHKISYECTLCKCYTNFISFNNKLVIHARIQRGDRGSGPPPPPLKNHKSIGFHSNTVRTPLKSQSYQASIQC